MIFAYFYKFFIFCSGHSDPKNSRVSSIQSISWILHEYTTWYFSFFQSFSVRIPLGDLFFKQNSCKSEDFLQICEGILKLENFVFLRKKQVFWKHNGVLDENLLFYQIFQELYYSEESNINTNFGHSALTTVT